jgi:hypothetical protein
LVAWIVAIEVPEFVSVATVRRLIGKEFGAGHFHDVSAVMLTRATPAGDITAQPTRTVAEEHHLVLNRNADVALGAFCDCRTLPLRIRGCPQADEPKMRIMSNYGDFDTDYGYIYQDFEWTFNVNANRQVVLQLPLQIPRVYLPTDLIPAPGADTLVDLEIDAG